MKLLCSLIPNKFNIISTRKIWVNVLILFGRKIMRIKAIVWVNLHNMLIKGGNYLFQK